MNRRPAATLVEVLVAIFIMGIGLLAILALFPLGAIRMFEAIQADRAAQLAQSATALAQAFDLRNDTTVTGPSLAPGGAANVPPAAVAGGPGYPVYIDAFGWVNSGAGAAPAWVGDNGTPGIRRVAPANANTTSTAVKWFALLDDIQFDATGVPPATGLDRATNLTYALMYRRPLKESNVAELAVVVYHRRPLSAAASEPEYPATFTPANNTILIDATGRAIPKITPGTWVLDATVFTAPNPTANSYFYRIASVNQPAPNLYEVEVGTPLRGWGTAGGNGRLIIMDNVVEVFEKGTGWAP